MRDHVTFSLVLFFFFTTVKDISIRQQLRCFGQREVLRATQVFHKCQSCHEKNLFSIITASMDGRVAFSHGTVTLENGNRVRV